ncbi:MAG: pyruvate, phosphate dikinase [Alphaproteobacteria bacterium]
MTQWVYSFGDGKAEGRVDMRELLGGKGANLAEMSSIGLPVPPGFTITTEVCTYYYGNDRSYPTELEAQILDSLKKVEAITGAVFGDASNPLLFSVRSGARVSMPGMMDTVLNLGLNDATVAGLEEKSGDSRFAWDSYRRFIQMYGDVVLDVDHHLFEELLEARKDVAGVLLDTELSSDDLKELVKDYKALVKKELGEDFPEDPHKQLWGAISAVFKSWQIPRAKTYRALNSIPEEWGTAVNVQAMVFGNMGEDCATGVAFTRDPSTGENIFYGEYLINAQGEDVVAGIRTPQYITVAAKEAGGSDMPAMEEVMPEIFAELDKVRIQLETHYRDMQDIEFTVQKGKLYMLQTRSGKRTTKAAIKIACDMVDEKLISKDEALLRVNANSLDQILHPMIDPNAPKEIIGSGLPASPGAATGQAVFCSDEAEALAKDGVDTILVRIETSPEDIHGMHAARGILTTRGGMTSHAAVVARGMGRPCVSGAGSISVSYKDETMVAGNKVVKKGDYITIDGTTGEIILGKVETIQPELSGDFSRVMDWADEARTLKIRTNADTPDDAKTARDFGAEGIGLCRTEHMFFEADRILAVRQMIMSETVESRSEALNKILPMQRSDFEGLFHAMKGLPVTIRLLDPPLHEFLPAEEEFADLAKASGVSTDFVKKRVGELHEFNPMLGHRGCRLLNTYPEICEMQARAIFEAAINVKKETGETVLCEVMIPLVSIKKELDNLKQVIDDTAKKVAEEQGVKPEYILGTMIELPRAALRADEIAENAEFFSFGTNDLTQTAYGLSRDDAARFLAQYQQTGILESDPFQTLDTEGVGELIKIAKERGMKTRPDIKLGICGEHGGDPASIEFCHNVGLQYVSCSPFRVPIARLAAAQSAINSKDK